MAGYGVRADFSTGTLVDPFKGLQATVGDLYKGYRKDQADKLKEAKLDEALKYRRGRQDTEDKRANTLFKQSQQALTDKKKQEQAEKDYFKKLATDPDSTAYDNREIAHVNRATQDLFNAREAELKKYYGRDLTPEEQGTLITEQDVGDINKVYGADSLLNPTLDPTGYKNFVIQEGLKNNIAPSKIASALTLAKEGLGTTKKEPTFYEKEAYKSGLRREENTLKEANKNSGGSGKSGGSASSGTPWNKADISNFTGGIINTEAEDAHDFFQNLHGKGFNKKVAKDVIKNSIVGGEFDEAKANQYILDSGYKPQEGFTAKKPATATTRAVDTTPTPIRRAQDLLAGSRFFTGGSDYVGPGGEVVEGPKKVTDAITQEGAKEEVKNRQPLTEELAKYQPDTSGVGPGTTDFGDVRYNGTPIGDTTVGKFLSGVIPQGITKSEATEQDSRSLNTMSKVLTSPDTLTGNEKRWYEDMKKTVNGRKKLKELENELLLQEPRSFVDKQQDKYTRLKNLGFTDAQINRASEEITKEGIPYTRT